ncbi:circadian clock protein KaiC [bacterium M00.F.Ca.ET.228.01.1.1]|uniref:ATPase domain-containing protein n=1 Tax=Paraburkholderia phenoliruptrix TaxID=252970 RepID=UPI0010928DAA|nr:ATPase domain-containing protein [Paraburkholderia phenoliruptrix]TGP39878.1 circadian clock protein KaiC [bacterium M00.F.Ca.ET.228.01.1.1]TGR95768.1 circadian clock protein KaiC [bacterium M00.F.Ca.ET.191.01.1.1]TGT96822.1 circadian clock protein KaiC [bacterium M00.F.Ca.ET.155.01.1.1]MBW0445778.1 circadian clock protein KaiC [Paraburkholderia phenoliruptrix]MBW9101632.1 circadian clock protein KaiC [Paraburkholderia phenoliruptrix]
MSKAKYTPDRLRSGIEGIDDILGGGLTPHRMYLVEGAPGTGKTTLALQFLLEGVQEGQVGLYITLSETRSELISVADSHGWDLSQFRILELLSDEGLDPQFEQTVLHPAEVELGETVRSVIQQVEQIKPARIVLDSLSELRLLSQNALRYRRQILALKRYFATRECTVLLLDDNTSDPSDIQLHSIAHGVITLDNLVHDYGGNRRRVRIAKMRGIKFREGYHDFSLDTGGIKVYPRLVAAEHHADFGTEMTSTGTPGLDMLLGGGLIPGTNALIVGPSGVGKTTTVVSCLIAALERGERCVYYVFDETLVTLIARCATVGMNLQPYVDSGLLTLRQIDPAEISPGEFASDVRVSVEQRGVKYVAIDSLNAYLQAMPGERYLLLQMHELLGYLNQQGVITMLVLGQHGIIGEIQSDIDISYLSDVVILFRYFEHHGEVLTAVTAVKSRANAHERSIRQFRLTSKGVEVGEALRDFEGVLSGLPAYRGSTALLGATDHVIDTSRQ